MPSLKGYAKLSKDGQYVTIPHFKNHEGVIDWTDKKVSFTINIAPTASEVEQTLTGIRKNLQKHIEYLEEVIILLNAMQHKTTEVTTDFYWGEGDLLVRIDIPFTHPLLKHLKLVNMKTNLTTLGLL